MCPSFGSGLGQVGSGVSGGEGGGCCEDPIGVMGGTGLDKNRVDFKIATPTSQILDLYIFPSF